MPAAAYDGNSSTAANVSSTAAANTVTLHVTRTLGNCTWSGFPATVIASAMTLSIIATVNMSGDGGTANVTATITGSTTSVLSLSASAAQATYTVSVPSGTDLSTISIHAISSATATPLTSDTGFVSITISEIFIS